MVGTRTKESKHGEKSRHRVGDDPLKELDRSPTQSLGENSREKGVLRTKEMPNE